jgi:hypothetical protein
MPDPTPGGRARLLLRAVAQPAGYIGVNQQDILRWLPFDIDAANAALSKLIDDALAGR